MTRAARRADAMPLADLGPLFSWPGTAVRTPVDHDSCHTESNDSAGSHGSGTGGNPGTTVPAVREPSSEKLNDYFGSRVPPLQGEEEPELHAPHQDPISSLVAAGNGGPLEGAGALVPLLVSDRIQTGDPEPDRDRRPTLRPYQVAAIAAIEAQWAAGILCTLLVLATGGGKTVIFAEAARSVVHAGRRALVLAHREELLEQAQSKLADVGVLAGIEKADRRAGRAPTVVASVQSLQGKRLAALDPREFGLVVVDEGHHVMAPSYRKILAHFAGVPILVVTATPDRGDGKGLREVVQTVAYRYELRDAIRDQWLVPIVARRIFVDSIDLSGIKSRAGDLAQDELAEVMAADGAVIGVVVPLLEQAGDRRTIVFAVSVAHAMALAQAICERKPGAARFAHGEMDRAARAELLADYRAGRFQFLVNCALYTEGFDEPSVACVACVRPTKSRALYTQMVGRATRLLGISLEESIANGKRDCLVLDMVGNAGRHKLVGPLDALADGDVPDDVRKEAERMLEDDVQDLDGLVDEAAAELERRREEIRRGAHASYFARDVDPFFGEQLGEPYTEPWALELATIEERTELISIGLKKVPAGLTRGEARQILEADRKRRKLGLATYKQCSLLARFGVDVKTMTKNGASARIGVLAQCDWDLTRASSQLRQIEARELIAGARRT